MGVFLLRRLATLVATLIGASAVIFLVLEILPGNAALTLLGADASPDAVAALTRKLGLDQPAMQRYLEWIGGILTGDLGLSYAYSTPVGELILGGLAISLPLAVMAMLLTAVIALSLGIFAAARHNTLADTGVMGLSQIGIAIPNFWFAILLILLFAVQLHWFAAGGFPGWAEGPLPALRALALPALALAVVQAAILARVTRSSIIEVMREDFVRTARAKGLTKRAALWRHVLRNAMIPVVTIMGLQFANLIAGTVVIENVFYLPGLGRLIFQAINNRDTIVVRDCVMLLAALVVTVNFVVDLVYVLIDPRLKAHEL
ncbi:peptide/nickel transport system permease protein [Rhizobiales bacterium GAS113]|nr:peptide/nickel transport system permease protein [Rhizobiales bacterium GAS113]